jgi:VWFA-related protein
MLVRTSTSAIIGLILSAVCQSAFAQNPVKSDPEERTFTLSVPVNEVNVMFHASDSKGLPLENLRKADLQLFDNGKLQDRLVVFREYRDLPIRVGFLLDNSPSMQSELDRSQAIATELTKEFFRAKSDRAFTMGFGVSIKLTQDWTEDSDSVSKGISTALLKEANEPDGTAMYDAVYKACRDRFSSEAPTVSGNFILLFTDGEDNSSHVWESKAVDTCQRARTAIYVFTPGWKARESRGQQLLEDLTSKTGGRVFYEGKHSVRDGLAATVADMRYQYELIYAPSGLKRDGSFHRIRLHCIVPHSQIQVRSGYYAYAKP